MCFIGVPTTMNSLNITDISDFQIYKEICCSNGIVIDSDTEIISHLKLLQVFFTDIPRCISLKSFPLLTQLQVIGAEISEIANMESCPLLTTLWLSECRIKKITGLSPCINLRELFLYQNEISSIENLGCLRNLLRLWLNENYITIIEGLDQMKELVELNLSGNLIETIGEGLRDNVNLRDLQLSGNKLYGLEDIINLASLPKLAHLGINNPSYHQNPVCHNANYLLLLLYIMPEILVIDGIYLASKELKVCIRNIMNRKKRFYHMKSESEKTICGTIVNLCWSELGKINTQIDSRIQKLQRSLNYLDDSKNDDGAKTDQLKSQPTKHKVKIIALKERLEVWTKRREQCYQHYIMAEAHLKEQYLLSHTLIACEFQLCGNLTIHRGQKSMEWLKLCSDFIASRFCGHSSGRGDVLGFRVRRIYRISNKLLSLRYADALTYHTDAEKKEDKESIEDYLFLSLNCDNQDYYRRLADLLKGGFKKMDGKPVHLTNSLNMADQICLQRIKQSTSQTNDCWPQCFSRVVLVRAQIDTLTGCFFKPGTHWKMETTNGFISNPISSKDCCFKQLDFYFNNTSLLLPEYIVDIEYLAKTSIDSVFYRLVYNPGLDSNTLCRGYINQADVDADEDVLQLSPIMECRSRVSEINETVVAKYCACIPKIAYKQPTLNLHDTNLKQLSGIARMTCLTHLTLSFCSLTKLTDLDGLPLVYFDVSHNHLNSLKGLCKGMPMQKLNVGWNRLFHLQKTLLVLHEQTPKLSELCICGNPWWKAVSVTERVISYLKCLSVLDGKSIDADRKSCILSVGHVSIRDKLEASDLAKCGRLQCLQHDYTHITLDPVARYLLTAPWSRSIEASIGMNSIIVYTCITSLCVEGQFLTRLANLDKVVNLRHASFNDNELTRIDGLLSCTQLEELSLADNCIEKLENIRQLTKLSSLILDGNHIRTLIGSSLDKLKHLRVLSLAYNKITSLDGIENSSMLQEVYLGNNFINDIKNIFLLNELSELMILELFGNPLEQQSGRYRYRIVHHLKRLKALDGVLITQAEINTSREMFGGKMTCEYLMGRLGHDRFNEIVQLDVSAASLHCIQLSPTELFSNLRSLNLENNQLNSFSGIVFLTNLRTLCLNQNHIETLFPRNVNEEASKNCDLDCDSFGALKRSTKQILPNLEVLHLAHNNLKALQPLQFHRIPSIKTLFVQYNELTAVEGLEALHELREVVFDRNRIKKLSEVSFLYNWNLQEIHLEENRLRDLRHLSHLERLQRLYIGSNKLSDLTDLEEGVSQLRSLADISLVNNPLARRNQHRLILANCLPRLGYIDCVPVSQEERERAAAFFVEQQYQSLMVQQGLAPGLTGGVNGGGLAIGQMLVAANCTPAAEITLPSSVAGSGGGACLPEINTHKLASHHLLGSKMQQLQPPQPPPQQQQQQQQQQLSICGNVTLAGSILASIDGDPSANGDDASDSMPGPKMSNYQVQTATDSNATSTGLSGLRSVSHAPPGRTLVGGSGTQIIVDRMAPARQTRRAPQTSRGGGGGYYDDCGSGAKLASAAQTLMTVGPLPGTSVQSTVLPSTLPSQQQRVPAPLADGDGGSDTSVLLGWSPRKQKR